MYKGFFLAQSSDDTDCTIYAINNLLQVNYKRSDILNLRRKNKKNKLVELAWIGEGDGLIVDWYNLLEILVDTKKYMVVPKNPDISISFILKDKDFFGLIGNLYPRGITSHGHAMSIVKQGTKIFLLDSMKEKPIPLRKNDKLLKNIQIFTIIYKREST